MPGLVAESSLSKTCKTDNAVALGPVTPVLIPHRDPDGRVSVAAVGKLNSISCERAHNLKFAVGCVVPLQTSESVIQVLCLVAR